MWSVVGEDGTHGLSSRRRSGRLNSHMQLKHLVRRISNSANVPVVLEPPEFSIGKTKNGKLLVCDVTAIDSLARSQFERDQHFEETEKRPEIITPEYFIFQPLAFETLVKCGLASKSS